MIEEDIKLNNLDSHINSVFKKDFFKNRIPCNCPICSSKIHIKYGFYNGIQRYKCKNCGKTFSNSTTSFCSYSKKILACGLNLWN